MGLRLVLKTKGAVKGLGVGTSFLRTMVTILRKEEHIEDATNAKESCPTEAIEEA